MTTRSKIIRIGNSQGLRLSKSILEASGISGDVMVEAHNGEIRIHAAQNPRDEWSAKFQEMADRGDDVLLDPTTVSGTWDESEWEWE